MTRRKPQDRGVGWVSLTPDVEMNRAWLVNRTPRLFAAWEQAETTQQRLRLAQLIQQVAAATESHTDQEEPMTTEQGPLPEEQEPWNEFVNVRIEWAETNRYTAEFYIDPNSSDSALRQEIAMAMQGGYYRELPPTDDDNRIISVTTLEDGVIDLDGDGRASVLERFTSPDADENRPIETTLEGGVIDLDGDGRASVLERFATPEEPPTPPAADYADLADSIDLRLAGSADWPSLNAALQLAAADGYDVHARLAKLAAQEPLPDRYPATELRYRLMADCDAALTTPRTAGTAHTAAASHQAPRPADVEYDLRPAVRDNNPPAR